MDYTFGIVGVSPALHFFNHQQENLHAPQPIKVEYLGAHKCTLDALMEAVEDVPSKRGWDKDKVIDTVIGYWMNNSEMIRYWKLRLSDAGKDNLLVARLGDIDALRGEFESLFGKKM